MSGNSPELGRLQRWMQSVIKHPDGIAAGIASDEARREIDVEVDDLSRVILRSQSLNEIERLSIYGNAYYARLLDCLRDEYPALQHALGEELFDGFAFGYLQAHPSNSYTLVNLGTKFADYLRETRPPRDEGTTGPDWADLMIDLARLERAYSEIFDGPGTEGQPALEAGDSLAIPFHRWSEARLIFAPCVRLMEFDFPVHEYSSAVRHDQSPELPEPSRTRLAITRREFVVRRAALSPVQFALLSELSSGASLSAAITSATHDADISDEELGQLLRDWFQEWTAARYFVRVELPN